jgi:hypothetical protein
MFELAQDSTIDLDIENMDSHRLQSKTQGRSSLERKVPDKKVEE